MFEYFPDNYPWSLSVVWAAEATGTFSEIHDAINCLRPRASEDPAVTGPLWYDAWSSLAAQRLRVAGEMEAKRFVQSAGRGYLRSGIYELMAIRFLTRDDSRGAKAYASGTRLFSRGLELLGKPAR